MTITTAPGALEFPFGGITKPGRNQIRCGISYMLIVCRAIRRYLIARRFFSTGQLRYIFLVGMVSMWIGLMVNRFGNRGRASKSKAEIDRWAVAYQCLERESECGRKEQAERSERQKRRLLRTLHSQQLHLGTRSRAMRDRLTRRYQRSLSRAQNEATGLRKEHRKVQTKPATIDPNESHGLIAHLRWQYDHAKLIIIKQSSTITRTEARVDESERNEANDRLSVENSKIQETNRQLSSELCETKVKLGHVTCCLQDALLPNRFPTTLKTNGPSAAEMLDEDSVQTTLIESGSKAMRPGRRSSVFQMERLQESIARPLVPLRRRSMSAAITVSSADTITSIPSSVESMSLQEIVAILRLVHGNQSQLGQDDASLPGNKGYSEETCSMASQGGDTAIIEGDGTPASFEDQPARKKHVRKRRRHRKMREELESQAFDEDLARPPPSNQL